MEKEKRFALQGFSELGEVYDASILMNILSHFIPDEKLHLLYPYSF